MSDNRVLVGVSDSFNSQKTNKEYINIYVTERQIDGLGLKAFGILLELKDFVDSHPGKFPRPVELISQTDFARGTVRVVGARA